LRQITIKYKTPIKLLCQTLEGGSLKNAEKLRKTIIEEYGITQAWIVKYQGNKRVFAK